MENLDSLPWGLQQRLKFIEFRAFWEDGINRKDIIERFNVSVPQASNDLTKYQELAPNNLIYNTKLKKYNISNEFKPIFKSDEADVYLNQLKSIAEKSVDYRNTFLAEPPDIYILPSPARRMDAQILKKILSAIKLKKSIKILYQSMTKEKPEPLWREISPHALSHDGMRWHIRAFCHKDKKYKDFLLSRLLETREFGVSKAEKHEDYAWNEIFTATFSTNPALSYSQQKIIEQDFNANEGKIDVPLKAAMLYYFEKRMRLDVAKTDRAEETPIILQNEQAFNDMKAKS